MIALRPYQVKAIADVRAAYRAGARRVLLVAPTGSGKTAIAAEMIRRSVAGGRRVIFAASLRELLTDTGARLAAAGIDFGFVQANRPSNPTAPVQLVGLQTVVERGERPPCDVFFLDEAHHAPAASVRSVLESYPDAHMCGLTATPARADGRGLADAFDRLVEGPSVPELVAGGHLTPVDLYAPATVHEGALAMDPVEAYARYGEGRRAVIFAADVAHATDITTRLLSAGVAAELLTGETADDVRAGIRGRITAGTTRVLVNVACAIEGIDIPALEVVIMARAFTSVAPFLQACGRAMRPSPATGKTRTRIVDLRGAALLHGLPDEPRRFSLEGAPVRRLDTLTAVMRCASCGALYKPSVACPRCGARGETQARIPRVLTRAERLERLSALPQAARDERYLRQLVRVARDRVRIANPDAARAWAHRTFRKRFGREPEVAA